MIIRNCTVDDVDRVRRFVSDCKPLELHTSFTYWTLFNYFSNLCFMMEEDEKVIGFISGIKSSIETGVAYLWQVGIAKDQRGKNYAYVLIDHFSKAAISLDCNKIQVSISPENQVSYNAFLKYSDENSYPFVKIGEVNYHDKLDDKHEFEILFQIEL